VDVIYGEEGNDFVFGTFDGDSGIRSTTVKARTNTLLTGSAMCVEQLRGESPLGVRTRSGLSPKAGGPQRGAVALTRIDLLL
jgi:hypothetical protein